MPPYRSRMIQRKAILKSAQLARDCILSSSRFAHSYCLDPSDGLNPEQQDIQKTAKLFAATQMKPFRSQWDQNEVLPLDVLKKAGEVGFGALYCGTDHGGSGLNRTDASVVFEQLSGACPSTAAFISIHNMCAWMIDTYASEELKAKHIPELATFDKLASYCLTEPDSGSDAAALRTSARKQGDYYVLNGSKAFISGAGKSSKYVVMVRHEGESGSKGIFALLVEKETEGLSFGKKEKKIGWNSQPTRIVTFEDCKVPITNQIGGDREGFKIAMEGINGGRLNIASCSLGPAQMAIDLAIDYVKTRKQFGKALADFQWTQFKLAEAATTLTACRLLTRNAAKAMDENSPKKAQACAMAKLFVTDNAFKIIHDVQQMFGGYGMLRDFPIEQFLRDCRVHEVIEGTNEMMRMIISRDLLTRDTYLSPSTA